MKILFIGGTGIISSGVCPLVMEAGHDLYLMNRGNSSRPLPLGANHLVADIRDKDSVKRAMSGHQFDAIVDWVAFTPEHIQTDIDLFEGKCAQYVFISSASAYQTPPSTLPVTESTVLDNPFWEYSRNKIACEELLVQTYRSRKFPATIVRPSHTYDKTLLPFDHGYTVVDRMLRGLPVVVHGDGTSLWVLTHHTDFAKGFVPLLGNNRAIGESYHITSDEWLTWNQIYDLVAEAAGTEAKKIHIASDALAKRDAGWGAALLGDKANSMVFDNTKIKKIAPNFTCTVPFRAGAQEIMEWYRADPSRQKVDERSNALMDELCKAFA